MTLIDAHVHVWDPSAVPGELGAQGSAEQTLEALDALEIARAVLVQPSVHASDHTYLLGAVDRAPDRLVAVVLLEPDEPGAVARLPAGDRVRGVRAPLIRARAGWIATVGNELWARAREEQWVIGAFTRSDQLDELAPWLERFPDVAVGIDHIARLDLADEPRDVALERVLALARFPQVHVKLSALSVLSTEPFPYRDTHAVVERVVAAFGPDRTIWGSDHPNTLAYGPYSASLEAAREALASLDPAERAQVLGGTARRLYFERAA